MGGDTLSNDKMSRRRFLTYVIGGTAGFLGASIIFPMVRYAVDPVLKKNKALAFFPTNTPVTEITDVPKSIAFKVNLIDGWYKPEEPEEKKAWVYRKGSTNADIVAFSPVCKHLGCPVVYGGNAEYPDEFFCPCHFGRYTKDGVNVPGTPPPKPLDRYVTRVTNGRLEIGPLIKS